MKDDRLLCSQFPRASRYHPDWVLATVGGGANSLWLAEWLSGAMELKAGMRVLDLGCGMAASSIFLHKEFGVEVWAADLWINPTDNMLRIRDAGVEKAVFPIHADARALPFPNEFFDAIVSIDSYPYYGTDDFYLGYIARLVKAEGQLGIAGAGFMEEIGPEIPSHLRDFWNNDQPWCLHSAGWWRNHWEKTGIVDVLTADTMPNGWQRWLDWHKTVAPNNDIEIKALEADRGRYMGYCRVVGRRRADVTLHEPIKSFPRHYLPQPLFRLDG